MFYDYDDTNYNDDYSEQFDVRQPPFQGQQGFLGGSFQQGFRQGYLQGYRQGFREGRRSCLGIGFPGFGPGPF